MGAHNVNDDPPAKLGEVVRSYHGVFVPGQDIVQPCLVLDEIINSGPILQGPFHMGKQASEREALPSAAFEHLLDQSQHPLLIEMAISQIRISPVAQLEATALFCRTHIDARRPQPPYVFLPQLRIDNMECLLTVIESLDNEWQQHPVLFVSAVKERAHVTFRAQR